MKRGIVFVLIFVCFNAAAQTKCTVTNSTFKAGEQYTYKIYYNWGALWMVAGEASFAVQLSNLGGRSVYHFTGLGTTYSKYDWFYKVRDKYESYADTATLRPLRFIREAHVEAVIRMMIMFSVIGKIKFMLLQNATIILQNSIQ